MCQFINSEVVKVHQLDREHAIIAYRSYAIGAEEYYKYGKVSRRLESPYKQCRLPDNGKMSAHRVPRLDDAHNSGIFAHKSAAPYDNREFTAIARVALYGTVIEYDGGFSEYRGYRAQRCEVLSVTLSERYYRLYGKALRVRYNFPIRRRR